MLRPLTALIAILPASVLHAATATPTASWDRNPEPDIAGYRLSYGIASGVYTTTIDVGNVTSRQLSLAGGQRYFFAVQAYDTAGLISDYSAEVAFDTPVAVLPPTVVTGTASGVGPTAATLNGTTNPNAAATTAFFQYGVTKGYGSVTTAVSVGSGSGSVAIRGGIAGLTCATTYHFRAVATNAGGTTYGIDTTVTTGACPVGPPSVATGTVSWIGNTAAIVNGAANPEGAPTSAFFQYGQKDYGSATPAVDLGAGIDNVPIGGGAISGLTCATTYRYRAVAVSAGGTAYGADAAFTTSPCGAMESIDQGGPRTVNPHTLLPPTHLEASIVGSTMTLRWSGSSRGAIADEYLVEAGNAPGSAVVRWRTGSAAAAFVATNVAPGTYYVRVRALNRDGASDPSNEVGETVEEALSTVGCPVPPAALTPTLITGSALTVEWRPPPPGCAPTSYTLEIGSAPSTIDLGVARVGAPATSLTLPALPPGTYFLRARAADVARTSGASNEVKVVVVASGRTCSEPPDAPVGLTSAVSGPTVWLAWAGSHDASSYVLEAGSRPGAADLMTVDLETAEQAFTAAASPGTYFMRVRARNECGTSRVATNEVPTVVR